MNILQTACLNKKSLWKLYASNYKLRVILRRVQEPFALKLAFCVFFIYSGLFYCGKHAYYWLRL